MALLRLTTAVFDRQMLNRVAQVRQDVCCLVNTPDQRAELTLNLVFLSHRPIRRCLKETFTWLAPAPDGLSSSPCCQSPSGRGSTWVWAWRSLPTCPRTTSGRRNTREGGYASTPRLYSAQRLEDFLCTDGLWMHLSRWLASRAFGPIRPQECSKKLLKQRTTSTITSSDCFFISIITQTVSVALTLSVS